MHHSSLQTPVGNSLGALAVSHTSIVGTLGADANVLVGPARDVVRYSAADLYFRPLLEGLALFMEFDATSGAFPLATWASHIAARLFCLPEISKQTAVGRDLFAPLKDTLLSLRVSPDWIDRKRALLSRDIYDEDGYLLGYMLVKTIWASLAAHGDVWRHSDMFAMFLMDYFFSDFRLAYRLVHRPGRGSLSEELTDLATYLYNRVVLLNRDCMQFGREFCNYHLTAGAPRPSYQQYSRSIEDALEEEWASRTIRNMHWLTPDFRSGRCVPRVLATECVVQLDGERRFEARFLDGNPQMRGPSLIEDAIPINADGGGALGSVEAIILLPQNGRVHPRALICVFLDQSLVATFDPVTRKFNDPDAVAACGSLSSFLAFESFAEQVQYERGVLPRDSAAARIQSSFAGDQSVQKMFELWGSFALCPDPRNNEVAEAARRFSPKGVQSALSLDDGSFERFVKLSLYPLPDADGKATRLTRDDHEWIERLNAKSMEVLGFRMLTTQRHWLGISRV